MWNTPNKERLAGIPVLYKTEGIPLENKLIYLHFFIFCSDWFIAEYDGNDLFWGYTIINNDYINAEWGYTSFKEMKEICINGFEIDCEVEWAWEVRRAFKVDKIRKANQWVEDPQNELEEPALIYKTV